MIIVKLAGGSTIILATLIFYLEIQGFHKKEIKQLDAFINLIDYIKNQIECYLLPFDDIIRFCDSSLLTECGITLNMLKANNLKEIISQVDYYFDEAAIELIYDFAEKFGHTYSKEQVASCEHCKNLLTKIKEKMIENENKNQKMRLALSLCVSFSIIILLL